MLQNLEENNLTFNKVVCGGNTTFLLDNKNELWAFGNN